jgi:hypothetical protein
LKRGLKDIIENLNVKGKHWFETTLETAFEKQERPPTPVDYFYAGWSGQCNRHVQAMMKAEGPYTPMLFRSRKAFEYGNSAHARYQDAIKAIDPTAIAEMRAKFTVGRVTISGKIDLVMTSPAMNKLIVEFKTLNGTEFKALKESKYEHLCQWTAYSHHLKLHNGLIIYENKDDRGASGRLPELKIYEVEYNPILFDKIINNFDYIITCNEAGTIATASDPCSNKYCELRCHESHTETSLF